MKFNYKVEVPSKKDKVIDKRRLMSVLPSGSTLRTFHEPNKDINTTIMVETGTKMSVSALKKKITSMDENGTLYQEPVLSLNDRVKLLEKQVKQLSER